MPPPAVHVVLAGGTQGPVHARQMFYQLALCTTFPCSFYVPAMTFLSDPHTAEALSCLGTPHSPSNWLFPIIPQAFA